MATEEALKSVTRPAAADLSTLQFRFVKLNGTAQATVTTVLGEEAYGILQNKPDAAGRAATITIGGVSKCSAGAAIAAGAKVMTDANGRAITATATNKAVGFALTAAANSGEIIRVEFRSLGTQ